MELARFPGNQGVWCILHPNLVISKEKISLWSGSGNDLLVFHEMAHSWGCLSVWIALIVPE